MDVCDTDSNPGISKNAACTIHGSLFYFCLHLFQWYTVLLSFTLFRQFYSPFKPMFGALIVFVAILCCLSLCCLIFVFVFVFVASRRVVRCKQMGMACHSVGNLRNILDFRVCVSFCFHINDGCVLVVTTYILSTHTLHVLLRGQHC